MEAINPVDVVMPASRYVQAVRHAMNGSRLVVSGQLGLRPDGTLEQGMRAQMQCAWRNVLAVMRAAGFERHHLVKATTFVTEPGQVGVYREVRDAVLEGHVCAMTFVQVAGLAAPGYLVEIEAEAVREG
jgi:enamine deaminase RidA (YjgF/YER057c/UK114 family)